MKYQDRMQLGSLYVQPLKPAQERTKVKNLEGNSKATNSKIGKKN